MAAVGGAVQGSDLSSWVAVATTAAAAFAAHLASQQHDRIAESYARTVLSLDALNRDFDPDSATAEQAAGYVANVERILASPLLADMEPNALMLPHSWSPIQG